MLSRTKLESIEGILRRAQLRWSGHVCRMSDDIIPKSVLYGQLSMGTRLPQIPKKRYKDQLRQSMRSFNLNPTFFWIAVRRAACIEGLCQFKTTHATERELRRQRRHAARQASPPEDNPSVRPLRRPARAGVTSSSMDSIQEGKQANLQNEMTVCNTFFLNRKIRKKTWVRRVMGKLVDRRLMEFIWIWS